MVKSRKVSMKHKKKRTNSKKNMRGGYSVEQNQQLLNMGFTEQFLQIVNRARVGFNVLLNDFHSSNLTADQYMKQTYDTLGIDQDDGFTDDEQDGGKKRKRNRTARKYRR